MALHGKTKIELTDVRTGRVETLEKNNFITNAIAAYNSPLGGLTDSYGLLSGARITDYFGGLCLFDKALEGDENTFFPQGGAVQVGAAEYGVTNATADTWLGSYNTNESNIDYANHTATFVYDFTTAQANGNIGAVGLAPAGCGAGGVWGVQGGSAFAMQNLAHASSNDEVGHAVCLNPNTAQYDARNNKIDPLCWDVENDVGYYINTTTTPYKVEKRRLYLKTASLFNDQRYVSTKLLESEQLDFDVSCSFATTGYDMYDDTHFCVYGYTTTKNVANDYAGELYCFVFGLDGTRYKTITVVSPCKKNQPRDISMAYLNGYLLLAGAATEDDGTVPLYRVPEGNPTDIQAAEIGEGVGTTQRYFNYHLGETYYCCPAAFDSYLYAIRGTLAYNVVSNKVTRVNMSTPVMDNSASYATANYKWVPILGHPFSFLFLYPEAYRTATNTSANALRRMRVFLSTINNLDEPVTKTADKTMKITYTITEVTE